MRKLLFLIPLIFTLLLSSCEKEAVYLFKKKSQPEPDPIACTKIYKPVCGKDGKTYGNECMAKAAGVEVLSEGECELCNLPTMCPEIYKPVCGKNNVTYSNSCTANAAGVEVAYEGECKECATKACYDVVPTDELCDAYFERWFYNPASNSCEKIGYSGCSPKGFETEKECEACKSDN